MDDFISIHLPRRYVQELIEELVEHVELLKATIDYLESGFIPDDIQIADVDNELEAAFIAEYYQAILTCIRGQLKK